MKQMYTPLVLLLLIFSVFTVDGSTRRLNPDQTKIKTNSHVRVSSENTAITALEGKPVVTITPITSAVQKQASAIVANNFLSSKNLVAAGKVDPMVSQLFTDGFWQGLFYGVVFLLIGINFVSFIIFDEKIYLVYGSSLVALAAFLFFSDGLFTLFDMYNPNDIDLVKASFFLIAAIASSIFGSYFLNLNTFSPKLKFISTGIFSSAAIILISGWFLENKILVVASNVLAMTVMATYFTMGVVLFGKKNYAKFYVVAMAFPILFTLDYLLAEPFSFSFLNINIDHIKGAVLVQIIMLTYGILYRIKEIKEENLIKQTELKIFLKRQEKTSRQKTEEHIEDVYLENVIMQYDLDGFEIKLLQYISEGKTNEKIARKLKLTAIELEEVTNELYTKLEIREHIKEDYNLLESQPDFIYN